jgi:hypothetical protein
MSPIDRHDFMLTKSRMQLDDELLVLSFEFDGLNEGMKTPFA